MASIRRLNALGQMRVDVPHLRMIESGVAHDFDVLAGKMMAGERPLVISGLTVLTTGMIGAAATSLNVSVAGALILHYGATDNGTIFEIGSDQAQEQLQPGNARLVGSWVASAVNYVGVDLQMASDDTTSDSVKFLDPDTDTEISRTVPLGRTLDYKFVLSTMPFSSRSTILPLAKVTLNSSGAITAIVDAREMMFRLGAGGDSPDQAPFDWPQAREEAYGGNAFAGGDKGISDLKSWADAVMTRIWEQGGGPNWYSATADRNVTMVWDGARFSNGENFEWDGANLHWQGLVFLFDNTPGAFNRVTDVTVDTPGITDLADGDCLYVDLDRSQNRFGGTALVAAKTALTTLGPGTVPGARWVIAWRVGTKVFTRSWRYPVGTTFTPATTTSLGVVQMNQTPANALLPAVVSIMADGRIVVTASAGNTDAATFTGFGHGAGVRGISVLGTGGTAAVIADNAGLLGIGANGASTGTVHTLFGRPGMTARGGTGAVGGTGGFSFGGNGDVALDANAAGGVGYAGFGGNGVGAGLGGEGISALGGLDGTGLIRQPSFVSPAPSSGPNPDVAFRSLAGSMEIPAADRFRFGADKTGFVIVHASEFQAVTGTSGGSASTTPPRYVSGVTAAGPFWGSLSTQPTDLSFRVRIPRGATITAGLMLASNENAVTSYNINYGIQNRVFDLMGTWTKTDIQTPINSGLAAASPAAWRILSISTPTAAPDGTSTSGFVNVDIILPQTAVSGDIRLFAFRFEYTYRTVDFLT